MASDDKPTPAARASAARDIAGRMAALTRVADTPARRSAPRRPARAAESETAARPPEPATSAEPAEPAEPATPATRERPTRSRDAGREPRRRAGATMPAEQPRPPAFYGERLSITTTAAQITALRAARVADGIEVTARIRAMIALWQDDPKLRARVDRAAHDWQS